MTTYALLPMMPWEMSLVRTASLNETKANPSISQKLKTYLENGPEPPSCHGSELARHDQHHKLPNTEQLDVDDTTRT
jgi:hypothetical protein